MKSFLIWMLLFQIALGGNKKLYTAQIGLGKRAISTALALEM